MKNTFLIFCLFIAIQAFAQTNDEATIRKIYDESLEKGKSYSMLEHLTTKIGERLSGSPGAEKSVLWAKQTMEDSGFDSVWLQPVMVPHWVRGQKEIGIIRNSKGKPVKVNVCALGGSVGTGPSGLEAQVIEIKKLADLALLGEKHIKGKIIFFNRPMEPKFISTFDAYGEAIDQRYDGPAEAAKFGAVGAIVRSMGSNIEAYPHTGSTKTDGQKIPAIAISTLHADWLSEALREDGHLKFYMESHCETLADSPSFNVVGEIKGSQYPEEIILVGGHLDSWDLAQGAHDDGTGCVQSIEVLRIYKAMGYKPKRTIRCVLFMNEENGLAGGNKYAELAKVNNEKHIAAIESDEGGFTPRGFTTGEKTQASVKANIHSWKPLLEPYGLTDFNKIGGGADIEPLELLGTTIIGFLPDSQRYFKYHHTVEDTFDKVDKRELELGAASMAALVYLIDKNGLR